MPDDLRSIVPGPAVTAFDQEELVGALHDVVLALGERLSDRALATARVLLSVGLTEDAAKGLVEAALESGTRLTAVERELLGLMLPADERDADLLAAVPTEEATATAPAAVREPADEDDAADRALVRALAGVPRCRGAWRADAEQSADAVPRPMWLVEAAPADDSGAGLARVAGTLHGVLALEGVVDPVVDVVDASGWLPPRPAAIRGRGRRIWPAAVAEARTSR